MALLDDITSARDQLQTRRNALSESITTKDGRYSSANADQQDSWAGRWLGADNERLRQVNLLSDAVKGSAWTATLDNEVSARKDAGFKQADYGLSQAESQRKTAAAKGGTAGGSWDAVVESQNAQEMARVKSVVTQQVNELRSAGIQNLDEMGQQLLSKALAGGEETGAMGVQSAATTDRNQLSQTNDQISEQYRNLLSNTVGGFLSNTVTPAVSMGFESAGRWNQQMRNDYTDARDTGAYQGNFKDWENANGGSRSWWGF